MRCTTLDHERFSQGIRNRNHGKPTLASNFFLEKCDFFTEKSVA